MLYFGAALDCDTPILESLFHSCFAYIVIRDVRHEKAAGKALFDYIHDKLQWNVRSPPGTRPIALSNSLNKFEVALTIETSYQNWVLTFHRQTTLNLSPSLHVCYSRSNSDYVFKSKSIRCLDAVIEPFIILLDIEFEKAMILVKNQ